MPLNPLRELSTNRLVVRAISVADLPDLLEVNGDPEVTEFLPYATWRGMDDATAWFSRIEALQSGGTGRQLVIERRADRRVVGTVLLFRHDEGSSRLELGYVVGRSCWRSGVATEALTAVCGACFGDLGIRRLEAEVHPDNVASNRLMRALGFTPEGVLRKRWFAKGRAYDTVIYGCLADEWPPRHRTEEHGVAVESTLRWPSGVAMPDR